MKTLVIEAGSTEKHYWGDLWRYRELFYLLVWRDLLVRYKQTFFGLAWAALRPLATMIIFTIVFGKLANFSSDGAPYSILVLAGLIPWQFFTTAFMASGESLIGNSHIISKVYFPRMIIPVSAVMVCLVDFIVCIFILAGLMWYLDFAPSLKVIYLPLFFILLLVFLLGSSLWISALNVKYRDFRYLVPFVIQLGTFISPVGFSSEIIPDDWRLLYSINPMVGIIDGFRWALIPNAEFYWPGFIIAIVFSLFIFLSGVTYFRKVEKNFADIV